MAVPVSTTDNASSSGSRRRTPHYLTENYSTKLATDGTDEQDRIRNAFHPGSFQTISSLPKYIQPDFAAKSRAEALERQSLGVTGIMRAGKAPSYFLEFEYIPEPYGLVEELSAMDKALSQAKQQAIAGDAPFVAPGTLKKAKFEGAATHVPDPYDAPREEQLRQRWLSEKKIIGGSFLPTATRPNSAKPSRASLTDMMTHLYRMLCDDWEEAQPTIFTTEEDLIVIYFNQASVPNSASVSAYMNVLAQHNAQIHEYGLSKVPEGWGMQTDDGHLMFALRPPWVRNRRYNRNDPRNFSAPQSGSASASVRSGV
eukprot:NODE_2354_length_1222_cov_32.161978_g2148_i0.p1 GENE.NODE_2354_length_1222_cov_32.161978_g2148_i0~~NODE_2354_length_1222_cov_32.161978_g2148_i0.p1  ORF type:complete len:313 (+),score=53.69 NODE_2354_length_1222_cov_32.161978_g2148_i0:145-1083(+)